MNLFRWGKFMGASGRELDWKIECDALTSDDWKCIAAVGARALPTFGRVLGIPRGGLPLAKAFEEYITPNSSYTLVVDDVWTTGKSMMEFANAQGLFVTCEWYGFVAFLRQHPFPPNIYYFAKVSSA